MKNRAESVVAAHPVNQREGGGSTPASALPEIEDVRELYDDEDLIFPVTRMKRAAAEAVIKKHHYTHSFPSGKSHVFHWRGVTVVFSIPANMNLGRFILKRDCVCWELSRMWASERYRRVTCTEAIRLAIIGLKKVEPDVEVLVSFADPNVGHEGTVYRAGSWIYTGRSEDPRGYQDAAGKFYPRRTFHSGGKGLTKKEIEERGFKQVFREGKHRFVRGITKEAKREIRKLWGEHA